MFRLGQELRGLSSGKNSQEHPREIERDIAINAPLEVDWVHRFRVSRDVFYPDNAILADVLGEREFGPHRCLAIIDKGVHDAWPELVEQITTYARNHSNRIELIGSPLILPGGEAAKNDWQAYWRVAEAIDKARLCRQSFVFVIGGGAVLDVAGFAAATVHRGVRLIRIPTTTLAQADSGVGVKNG